MRITKRTAGEPRRARRAFFDMATSLSQRLSAKKIFREQFGHTRCCASGSYTSHSPMSTGTERRSRLKRKKNGMKIRKNVRMRSLTKAISVCYVGPPTQEEYEHEASSHECGCCNGSPHHLDGECPGTIEAGWRAGNDGRERGGQVQ